MEGQGQGQGTMWLYPRPSKLEGHLFSLLSGWSEASSSPSFQRQSANLWLGFEVQPCPIPTMFSRTSDGWGGVLTLSLPRYLQLVLA